MSKDACGITSQIIDSAVFGKQGTMQRMLQVL